MYQSHVHGCCATIANFDVILKNGGAPDGQEKQYPRFHFGLRWNRKIAKIDIPTLRNEFLYFGQEVDEMFNLDTDKGIGDARKKLREQREQFVSFASVTEQEKIRIQAMNNQDNYAKYNRLIVNLT